MILPLVKVYIVLKQPALLTKSQASQLCPRVRVTVNNTDTFCAVALRLVCDISNIQRIHVRHNGPKGQYDLRCLFLGRCAKPRREDADTVRKCTSVSATISELEIQILGAAL